MADLLRGYSTATARVHAEHHSLHVVIISQLAQVLSRGSAHDTVSTATQQVHGVVIYDIAVGIVDGNLLSVILFLRLDVEHVRECQLWNLIILVEFQAILDFCFDLLGEQYLVDEFGFDIILGIGESHDAVVSQLVQVFGFHLTTLGNLLQPVVPDTVQISLTLFTVVFAHARQSVALHITLIFTYFGHLVFDAEFVVQTFHILTLSTEALEVNHTMIVQVDVVGHTCHIVGCLHVLVGVCHNPLAALLELLQHITQLLGSGWCIETGGTTL